MSDHGMDEDEIESDAPDELSVDDGGDAETTEQFEDWVGGDLEAAYLKAMSALEASDSIIPAEASTNEPSAEASDSNTVDPHHASSRKTSIEREQIEAADAVIPDHVSKPATKPLSASSPIQPAESVSSPMTAGDVPPTPRQIIEACLFVGGDALTASRLAAVLRGDFQSDFVEHEIDELNRLYAAENRPYEIRLGEGGYRLTLREEFERIRHKVYGLGPKEVRLSQEAMEVLAVVAYHQPIKQARVEELKPGCGAVLRQLVRRELLAVERDPAQSRDVNYKTTSRFLSLFGLGSLDELPQSEQVTYK